jgi:hypothetical protein
VVQDVDFHTAEKTQNPHAMIADQIEAHEEESGGEIYNPPLEVSHEAAAPAHDAAVESWKYDNHNIQKSSYSNSTPFLNDLSSSVSSKGGGWLPWILGPLALFGVLFLVLNFLSGATITLIAKESTVPMDQKFTAIKDATDGELSYSVMKVELTDSYEVPATGTKTVTTKAVGKIVVYNEQLTLQRLIKNTRFESPVGKIYRINESISVPKATTKSGKTTPGSLEVTIYADEAGAEYNSDPTDFSIPGLKNTPQAKLVYARSKGPLAGGASGTIKSVSDQDLKKAGDDLRVSLETKLRTKARGDLAPSQIAYDQGIFVDLKDPILSTEKATSDEKAVVTKSGTLYMIVFDRAPLIKAILKAVVPTYGGEDIILNNLENLTFSAGDLSGSTLWSESTIEFSLKGTPSLKWSIDQDSIKKDLLGLLKSDFNSKMSSYPTVERAKASLRPFWKQRFPTDPSAIVINIVDQIPD